MSRTRRVAAAPQAVWDVLADFGAISSWAPSVDHSCLLGSGPGGAVGTSRRIQVGRNTLVERITEYASPTTLGYRIEGLPRRLGRVSNTWRLKPAGSGHTEVTLTSTVEIGANPVARLTETVVCRLMGRHSTMMMAGLAELTEG